MDLGVSETTPVKAFESRVTEGPDGGFPVGFRLKCRIPSAWLDGLQDTLRNWLSIPAWMAQFRIMAKSIPVCEADVIGFFFRGRHR